ncbi:hypothetical protein [Mycobacterium scrofulaceum]|uniref:hypothetical protein n=1 Tax=Mycobacterium scrofulaceum TaxID=1783 RepID=UPI0018D3FB69|nr:hypothetical protein [Mycobacterium scrofulaceum]
MHQRAGKLRNAISENRLGDTLSLLVIAEEALHKWQRLNLARIEAKEPDQLLRAIDEARGLVDHHLREDLDIYRSAKESLDRFGQSKAVDGFRFWAVRELAKQGVALRDELDRFAKARQHQVETWEDFHIPSVLDAALATLGAVGGVTGRAFVAVGRGVVYLGGQVVGPFRGRGDDGSHASSSGLEEHQPAC